MATVLELPASPALKKPRIKSPQDKKLINDIVLAGQQLNIALSDPEAIPLLAEGGYTAEELQAGLALQEAAMQAFIDRQEADARRIAATRAFNAADKAARTTYTKLRGFAKSAFLKDAVGREALGLNGREPADQQNFIGAATALIEQGRTEPYAAKLATKSVTAAKLTDFAAKIEAWKNADQAQTAALSAVPRATTKRDKAANALFDWMAEYKQFARTQFKDEPAIARRLLL